MSLQTSLEYDVILNGEQLVDLFNKNNIANIIRDSTGVKNIVSYAVDFPVGYINDFSYVIKTRLVGGTIEDALREVAKQVCDDFSKNSTTNNIAIILYQYCALKVEKGTYILNKDFNFDTIDDFDTMVVLKEDKFVNKLRYAIVTN